MSFPSCVLAKGMSVGVHVCGHCFTGKHCLLPHTSIMLLYINMVSCMEKLMAASTTLEEGKVGHWLR